MWQCASTTARERLLGPIFPRGSFKESPHFGHTAAVDIRVVCGINRRYGASSEHVEEVSRGRSIPQSFDGNLECPQVAAGICRGVRRGAYNVNVVGVARKPGRMHRSSPNDARDAVAAVV